MDTKNIYNSLPENLKAILTRTGITDFFPPQAQAVQKGLLEPKNMVLSMPTASGKTLVAEIAMLHTILSKKGRCLYIVPLKALASEKYEDFKEKYSFLNISVGMSTGDFDYVDRSLSKNDIMISTAEKIDSLLRQNPAWLCENLGCVVADEIHYIGDPNRGPTLETVLTRLRVMKPDIKILGLSATIGNAKEVAGWLNASLVTSTWRPVDLKEGVYCEREIYFADGSKKEIPYDIKDDIAALAVDCVQDKGQALVFVNTRKSAQAEAKRISKELHKILSAEDRKKLLELSEKVVKGSDEYTKLGKQLGEYMVNGVVFHHAGLEPAHRKIIEDNFRQNVIKVICATPTLAVGVNLPSRRTIIRGLYRYVSGAGMKPVSVMEYKQMSGRAGRPKYDKYGESIIVAKSKEEKGDYFADFIFADSEPIRSHLGTESALRVHILSSIASGFITSVNSAFDFIKKTFFSYQEKYYDISEMILDILDFLSAHEMIERKNNKLLPTALGTRISRLYIDPISAVVIKKFLTEMHILDNPYTILYFICALPDMFTLAVNKSDLEKLMLFADQNKDKLNIPVSFMEDYSSHLAKVKTLWMISRWMDEEREETICEDFGVGPGDVHRFVDTAEWLVYSTIELAKLLKVTQTKTLHNLRTQVRYGVKPELVELVNLRGVGRLRARNMFRSGLKTITAIKSASLETLQKVPTIGKELAKSIKEQAEKK